MMQKRDDDAAVEPVEKNGSCHLCGRSEFATALYGKRQVCAADAIDYALNTELHENALRDRIKASVGDIFGSSAFG